MQIKYSSRLNVVPFVSVKIGRLGWFTVLLLSSDSFPVLWLRVVIDRFPVHIGYGSWLVANHKASDYGGSTFIWFVCRLAGKILIGLISDMRQSWLMGGGLMSIESSEPRTDHDVMGCGMFEELKRSTFLIVILWLKVSRLKNLQHLFWSTFTIFNEATIS